MLIWFNGLGHVYLTTLFTSYSQLNASRLSLVTTYYTNFSDGWACVREENDTSFQLTVSFWWLTLVDDIFYIIGFLCVALWAFFHWPLISEGIFILIYILLGGGGASSPALFNACIFVSSVLYSVWDYVFICYHLVLFNRVLIVGERGNNLLVCFIRLFLISKCYISDWNRLILLVMWFSIRFHSQQDQIYIEDIFKTIQFIRMCCIYICFRLLNIALTWILILLSRSVSMCLKGSI